MSWLNRKEPKTNEFGVIPVLFHTACNLVGEHGTVRVSSRKLGLRSATVSFHLPNVAEAPPFTPRLFMELEAAAESQGYILHELVSYIRISAWSGVIPGTEKAQDSQANEVRHTRDQQIDREGSWTKHREHGRTEAGFAPLNRSTGTIHHAEAPAAMGEALLRNAARVPAQTSREVFDLHRLNGNFANLEVPAFLRKEVTPAHPALERMDTAIKALIVADERAWPLDPARVATYLSYLTPELREECQSAALLLAAKKVNDPAKHEELLQELATLSDKYVEMPDTTPAAK